MRKGVTLPIAAFSDPDLPPRALRVLAALCFYDPQKTGVCSVKRSQVARLARVSENYVTDATARLKKLGWLGDRIGNGGRQRANTYGINWHHTPPNLHQSGVGLNTTNLHQSGVGLNTTNLHQSGVGLDGNPHQTGEGLTSKPTSEKGTFTGETHPKLGEGNQITDIYINNNNQIRSDGEGGEFSFGVDDVINILVKNGMPLAFMRSDTDRALVNTWLSNGVTKAIVTAACERAVFSKTDGKPFGPRYIDKVLETIAKEESKKRETNASNNSPGFSAGEEAGEQFLREQEAAST